MRSETHKKGLVFVEEGHKYFFDGKPVPSVSAVIKAVGLGRNYEGVDTFYRDRGIAVHRAIQLYLKGTLDEESLDPVIFPYFRQAKEWIDINVSKNKEWGAFYESEAMKYFPDIGVAGTIDLIYEDRIYDWKTSKSVDAATEIQGAFYKVLAGGKHFSAIQLDGTDGPAKEIPYEAGPELVDAVMTLYKKWKRK